MCNVVNIARDNTQPETLNMSFVQLSVEVLCQKICNVIRARNFMESEVVGAQSVLHPQIGYCQVADAAKAAPPADADCGRCIRVPSELHLEAEIQT